VPAQARVTAQTLLQYNAMQLGIFQLLEARREEFDVELAYVETLREYWSASAELDAVLAGTRVMQDDRNEGRGAGMGASAQPNGGH
jgi:cobalt-zinc-cadmium efflux system outer membrane protein